MNRYARIRRRDGAYQWGIYQDTEAPDRYMETFLVHSWAEHLRQHERQTQADQELERRVSSCISGEPKVHHMIYAHSKANSSKML
ncbi:MAG TPA: MFS transporter [Candidatus Bathyarchaeia archaeon]|nr:MFS transporter [Candidatus Bathyarchaeia archaeon]